MAQPVSPPVAPHAVLRLEGVLDVGSHAEVCRRVVDLRTAARDVMVDLDGVTFIDCVGIGSLVRGRREVESAGGRWHVRTSSRPVDVLLRLTRTDGVVRGTRPDVVPDVLTEPA